MYGGPLPGRPSPIRRIRDLDSPSSPHRAARAYRFLLLGYVVLFVIAALALVTWQLPLATFFLALLVVELAIGVIYG